MEGFSNEDIFRNVNFEDIFQGFGGGGIEDIFDLFGFGTGRSRSRSSGPRRGSDIYTEVETTFTLKSKSPWKKLQMVLIRKSL